MYSIRLQNCFGPQMASEAIWGHLRLFCTFWLISLQKKNNLKWVEWPPTASEVMEVNALQISSTLKLSWRLKPRDFYKVHINLKRPPRPSEVKRLKLPLDVCNIEGSFSSKCIFGTFCHYPKYLDKRITLMVLLFPL